MYTYVITAIAAAAIAAAGTWNVQSWRYAAKDKARLEQIKKDEVKIETTIVAPAAEKFEVAKAKIDTKYITITQTVEKIIDRPVYKNICIDADGVNAINSGILP